ncbi:MAG: hypothetical protein GY712_11625 [Oceanicoccus sp.]|uniref:hypothetical protein n=1 Tax=Oceanicoccus sp. TaxID=2691044 RepID=UPI00262E144A|nr:hypothetical protein [Oceanicoccus sp.]MCP3908651.1 hypothetical protein [Oceanicoccus sp.]MDG1772777.1 hypothetical protein [Oceanicoccus sp.]
MRVVESQWWIIELPEEWEADQDEDTILISDEDGVGEIAITTLEKESGLVDETELQDYMNDVVEQFGPAELAQVAELDGYYIAYKEDGDAVREWYLRYDNLLVLITYSCDDDNAGMDDGAVNEILETLFIKVEEPEE